MTNREPYTDEEIAYLRLCAIGAKRPMAGPGGMTCGHATRWVPTLDALTARLDTLTRDLASARTALAEARELLADARDWVNMDTCSQSAEALRVAIRTHLRHGDEREGKA